MRVRASQLFFIKLFLLFCVAVSIFSFYYYRTVVVHADDNEKDFTFYKVSSAAAAYLDDTFNGLSDNKPDKIKDTFADNWANAGGMMGFIDTNYDTGFIGSMVSFLAASTQSRGYNSFYEMSTGGQGTGLLLYSNYGKALNDLGLDDTAWQSLSFDKLVRTLIGFIVLLFYAMCYLAEQVMYIMIGLIKMLNPFQWFLPEPGEGSPLFDELKTQIDGEANISGGNLMSGTRSYYWQIMTLFQSMGYVLLAISFAVLVYSIIVLGKQASRGKIKKFIFRFCFVVIGIPVLGLFYTSMLTELRDDIDKHGLGSNEIVLSTFVDFENWAKNTRLALPPNSGITLTGFINGSGTVNMAKTTSLRSLARRINNLSSSPLPDSGLASGSSNFSKMVGKDGKTLTEEKVSEMNMTNNNVFDRPADSSFDKKNESAYSSAFSLLSKYISNDFYKATDFETLYKARNFVSDKVSKELFEKIKDDGDYSTYFGKDKLYKGTTDSGGDYLKDGKIGYEFKGFGKWDGVEDKEIMYRGQKGDKGLSTLSMYNYLNTTFDGSSISVYSEKKSTSTLTRHAHFRAVAIGGYFFTTFMYLANAIVMLMCLSVLAISYSFGMLFGALGKMMKIVSTVPWAVLGGMKAIIKLITLTLVIIMEVLGTIIAYRIVSMSFIAFNTILEKPMTNMFMGREVLTVGIAYLIMNGILMLSVIANIYFFITALRMRKSIVKALKDWTGEVIDKLLAFQDGGLMGGNGGNMGAKTAMANGSGLGGSLMKAAAGGAAMAGGHAMMSKMGSKGSPNDISKSNGDNSSSSGTEAEASFGTNSENDKLTGSDFDKLGENDTPLLSGPIPDIGTGSLSDLTSESSGISESELKAFDDKGVSSLSQVDSAASQTDSATAPDLENEYPEQEGGLASDVSDGDASGNDSSDTDNRSNDTVTVNENTSSKDNHDSEKNVSDLSGNNGKSDTNNKSATDKAKSADNASFLKDSKSTRDVNSTVSAVSKLKDSATKTRDSVSENNNSHSHSQSNDSGGSHVSNASHVQSDNGSHVNKQNLVMNSKNDSHSNNSHADKNFSKNDFAGSKIHAENKTGVNVKEGNVSRQSLKVDKSNKTGKDNNQNNKPKPMNNKSQSFKSTPANKKFSQEHKQTPNKTEHPFRKNGGSGLHARYTKTDNQTSLKIGSKYGGVNITSTGKAAKLGVTVNRNEVKKVLNDSKFQKKAAIAGGVVGVAVMSHSHSKKKKLEEKNDNPKKDYI